MAWQGWDKKHLRGVGLWRMQGTGLARCRGHLCSAGTTQSRRERGPHWGLAPSRLWEHPWGLQEPPAAGERDWQCHAGHSRWLPPGSRAQMLLLRRGGLAELCGTHNKLMA